MVSLSDDTNRSRGTFFEDAAARHTQLEEELTESATLSLITGPEPANRKINTTFVIALEIVILLGIWVAVFLLPALCHHHTCGPGAFSLIIYIIAAVWVIQFFCDRFYRCQHYYNRLYGYLDFYRKTRNIRRLPLLIASAANAILLILVQVLSYECPADAKCGHLNKESYIAILVSLSCAFQILPLIVYFLRTISFNKSGARPDVTQDEMVTNFLQTHSGSTSDIGFRDENFMDQVLERQADMIRYLKNHNMELGKRILVLTEENQALKKSRPAV